MIYGVLDTVRNNNKLIIFVHGLAGDMREHQFYNAAKFFPQKGFDTLRFDLYSWEDKGRSLSECTLETHGQDITTVIREFTDKYDELFLVGHSLGGPSILSAELDSIKSMVFWDPSYNTYEAIIGDLEYKKEQGLYVLDWGTEFILSQATVDSWKRTGDRMLPHISKPVKYIFAGKSALKKAWQDKLESIKPEYEQFTIEEAGHTFDEAGVEEVLFEETLKWVSKK